MRKMEWLAKSDTSDPPAWIQTLRSPPPGKTPRSAGASSTRLLFHVGSIYLLYFQGVHSFGDTWDLNEQECAAVSVRLYRSNKEMYRTAPSVFSLSWGHLVKLWILTQESHWSEDEWIRGGFSSALIGGCSETGSWQIKSSQLNSRLSGRMFEFHSSPSAACVKETCEMKLCISSFSQAVDGQWLSCSLCSQRCSQTPF